MTAKKFNELDLEKKQNCVIVYINGEPHAVSICDLPLQNSTLGAIIKAQDEEIKKLNERIDKIISYLKSEV